MSAFNWIFNITGNYAPYLGVVYKFPAFLDFLHRF